MIFYIIINLDRAQVKVDCTGSGETAKKLYPYISF